MRVIADSGPTLTATLRTRVSRAYAREEITRTNMNKILNHLDKIDSLLSSSEEEKIEEVVENPLSVEMH